MAAPGKRPSSGKPSVCITSEAFGTFSSVKPRPSFGRARFPEPCIRAASSLSSSSSFEPKKGWRRDGSERMNATAPPRFGGIWRPTPLPHVLKMSSPDNTVWLTLFFSSLMAFLRSK